MTREPTDPIEPVEHLPPIVLPDPEPDPVEVPPEWDLPLWVWDLWAEHLVAERRYAVLSLIRQIAIDLGLWETS